ncbi:amidase [Dyadobacter sandarakinus]|uniref:Amidase n=1 Tax=Dyadobacter sandarakinus TaxID=2747268 RepID=A0ABX7IEN2_9BACT|nr:amidase [Dyadobacter sandarakinus]QRR03882.1 amidase [Dyadobacter sandarakinus]
MNRRSFVRLSSSAWLGSLALVRCSSGKTEDKNTAFELSELSIADLQAAMSSGKFTSRSITQLYLDEIARIDKAGPKLRSVIEINPDALSMAEALDTERRKGKLRGPLHGIPILLKDNIDTADKMQTTAGSLALEGNRASADALLTKNLREAGAVILGKTNLSEFANFRSNQSSSGWSSRGGQTRNPYVLDRSPCGSSSGSAVAVAANLCAAAVGTETNGSIACPASMNNIVGIKPTVGLISRTGIIPISATQDTAGPFGRNVADAAALLIAMIGHDVHDHFAKVKEEEILDLPSYLLPGGLKGKRIGVEKSFLKKQAGIDALLQKALEQMRSAGATIVEVEYMKSEDLGEAESTLLQYEFKDGLNKYLANSNAKVKSLQEVIDFNKAHEATAMPTFKQDLLEISQAKGNLDDQEYKAALAKILHVRMLLDSQFTDHQLDALCGPATGPSWCIDPVNGDSWTGYGAYGPAAIAGYPSITVPMGFVQELPVGLSFLGRQYHDRQVVNIGYAYEQISRNRKPPRFLPSIQ